MVLYGVNYKGPISSNEWSIVTIHKTEEGANKALKHYNHNCEINGITDSKYKIVKIDTDIDSDIVYDYDNI